MRKTVAQFSKKTGANPVLQVAHLSKKLGGKPILQDCSLTLNRGELKVLIGPSGAG